MKTLITTIALAVVSFGALAQAQSASPNTPAQKTRAEVRAEVAAAIAKGERLFYGEVSYVPRQPVTQGRTRAEVRTEVAAAIANGERLSYGEASYVPPQPVTHGRTRAKVRAEVAAAIANGERLFYGEASDYPQALRRAETAFARSRAKANLTVSAK